MKRKNANNLRYATARITVTYASNILCFVGLLHFYDIGDGSSPENSTGEDYCRHFGLRNATISGTFHSVDN